MSTAAPSTAAASSLACSKRRYIQEGTQYRWNSLQLEKFKKCMQKLGLSCAGLQLASTFTPSPKPLIGFCHRRGAGFTEMATFVLGDKYLSLDSVRLGRFVKSIAAPQDSYYDPSPAPDLRSTVNELQGVQIVDGDDRGGGLFSKLTRLAGLAYSKRHKVVCDIRTKCVKQYTLDNSEEYYRNIIQRPEMRMWIETAIMEGDKICLLVGFMTFQDAKIIETDIEFKSSDLNLSAPITAGLLAVGVPLATIPGAGDLLDTGVEFNANRGRANRTEFEAKGEQVFALKYRKVRASLLSSRDLEGALRDSQWKVYMKARRAHTTHTNDVVDVDVCKFDFEEDDDEKEEWTKIQDEGGDYYL